MLTVTDATKEAWASETSTKTLSILIVGEGFVENEEIEADSFTITESLMSSRSFEAVGCISKKLEFVTSGFNRPVLKNKRIYASIKANNTEEINIFAGLVDSGKKLSHRGLKKITAYDEFYRLSNVDVTDWYNNLEETTIYGALQDFALHNAIGIAPNIVLINGTMPCFGGTYRRVKKLSGLDFLKHVCQINGCFGYFNNNGVFDVKYINVKRQRALYPADSLFPSNDIYPSDYESGGDVTQTIINAYESLDYSDYTIKPIDNVIIRDTSKDYGVQYYGGGANSYIIQGNIFAFNQDYETLHGALLKIFNVLSQITFRPFKSGQNAYPWLECGDNLIYYDYDNNGNQITVETLIMARTLKGDQAMWDDYKAEGEIDELNEFDLKAQLEDIQNQLEGSNDNG